MTVQLAAAASELPQLLVSAKLPVAWMRNWFRLEPLHFVAHEDTPLAQCVSAV